MKTALVTGGASGIGLEIAKKLSCAGYSVAITYNSSRLEAEKLKRSVISDCYYADMADKESLSNAIIKIKADHPNGFDLLVNNAGIAEYSLLSDITDAMWNRMIAVNLTAPFKLCREFSPYMIRQGRGCIINISSIWGICGASCESHYSAAKSGLIGLSKAMAKELGPSGIRVNAVCPGVIETKMTEALGEDTVNSLIEETPLGRLGTPKDIAELVLFLAEESGSFITGQVISPNGGFVV